MFELLPGLVLFTGVMCWGAGLRAHRRAVELNTRALKAVEEAIAAREAAHKLLCTMSHWRLKGENEDQGA